MGLFIEMPQLFTYLRADTEPASLMGMASGMPPVGEATPFSLPGFHPEL